MAIKMYFTFPEALELEPHYQIESNLSDFSLFLTVNNLFLENLIGNKKLILVVQYYPVYLSHLKAEHYFTMQGGGMIWFGLMAYQLI